MGFSDRLMYLIESKGVKNSKAGVDNKMYPSTITNFVIVHRDGLIVKRITNQKYNEYLKEVATGHSNIKKTQHYAKMLSKKVIEDMAKVVIDKKIELIIVNGFFHFVSKQK